MNPENNGFSFIEVILVVCIICILSAVAIPIFINQVEKSRTLVCNTNCIQLERIYELHLIMEDKSHTENVFEQYLNEYNQRICPSGGNISYEDESVKCSIHSGSNDSEKDDNEEVPYL